jgi:glycosyltransferase involved in cell wall biosynthesis
MLTIVIPTYNRLSSLQDCLGAIRAEFEEGTAETIVVDDASQDGTWDWLQTDECKSSMRLRSVRLDENRGPGGARNAGLNIATGSHFCPVDSDMMLISGAGRVLQDAIAAYPHVPLLFFPCIEHPAMRRMDALKGNRPVSREDLLYERVRGELIPVVNLQQFRERDLQYPEFLSGGEGILWIRTLADRPGLFIDEPILYYRTDAGGRICTIEHQLRNFGDLAGVSDAVLELFPIQLDSAGRRAKAKRLAASAIYHLLDGNVKLARARAMQALQHGALFGSIALAACLMGPRSSRTALRVWRSQRTGFGVRGQQVSLSNPPK